MIECRVRGTNREGSTLIDRSIGERIGDSMVGGENEYAP